MPTDSDGKFDHLPRYEELTARVHDLAVARPDLVSIESIGKSYEGRDIWLLTLTNSATGPHDEKPAVWVDANIHSTEVAGSVAALFLLQRLVDGHGTDAQVTRALDTRTFYVVPRANPDGVELALATPPTFVRSATRRWPRTDDAPGLVEGDVDGDGRVLTMRVEDPLGAWKTSEHDVRLLVPRAPEESGPGPYFRLLLEGSVRDYDGVLIPLSPERRSLDLNRNFPAGWRTEGEQQGAGPYPTSEAEVRALTAAITDRPNICFYFAHHTFSGVILRPYDDRPDEQMPTADLKRFKEIGAKGTEITGYKTVSVYHDFRYDPKEVITGAADTWAYDHLGIFGFTTEFWSPIQKAGISDYHLVEWFDDHPIEHDLALLRLSDEQLGGRGFVDWYAFDHPQLGRVELGGWDWFRFWGNPPDELLRAEIAPHADFEIWCALVTPRLTLREAEAVRVGEGVWRVRAVVANEGWLPTNVTVKATERKVVREVEAEIVLGAGATLESGVARRELGQLAGRSRVTTMVGDFGAVAGDATPDLAKAEWFVTATAGTRVDIVLRHPRAGTVRAAIELL